MTPFNLRSLLLAAIFLSNCISWTASRHHYTHNVNGHRSRHRRQGAGLFLSASYVLPGGEGSGWGEWGEVSPCSRSCGGGVASQKRICLQLGPDGQPQCSGGDTKYFSCQTQDCPAGSKDFRAEQCSEYDDQLFRDIKYKWVPYTKAPNPCELNCMPHAERFYYRHKAEVIDGTRCNDDSFDVCVNGTCQPVGCDMMLGSSAKEDNCRECRGNNANCHTTSGLLDTVDLRKGYNDMLLIPEGSTTIVIAEVAPSNNYLGLRAKNGTFYLNGDYHIDFPRNLFIAGALWSYERSQQGFAAPDKLRCLGPTNEPLYLSLLLQDENVGIEYEYSLPTDMAPRQNKRYNWVHDEFTPCSTNCGGGFQTRTVTCRSREELEVVDDGLCDDGLRPPTNQSCNTQACDPQWVPGAWGQCSKRCGKGGSRSREVSCQKIISNGYPSIVAEKECFELLGPKPELFQTCNENATCPTWFTGPWKPCNMLCDEGKQSRQVVCYQKTGRRITVLGDDQCEDERPAEEQPCMLKPCEGIDWVVSPWNGCDSCLSTIRTRTAFCANKNHEVKDSSFCDHHPTPSTQEACDRTKLPACEVQWYATQWSNCSVKCGEGLQSRKVFCGLFDGASVLKVDDSRCAGQTKYNVTKTCEIPKEQCPKQWFTGPWSACDKTCGSGVQLRRVMCLQAGDQVSDCHEFDENVPEAIQTCNNEPCTDDDELLPVAGGAPLGMDDLEDCEDEYPEVGLDDADATTLDDMMYSDSSTTLEGSGWATSELESEFTDSGSGTGSTETLSTDDLTTDTDSDETGSGSTTDTLIDDTDSTLSSDDLIARSGTGSTETLSTDDLTTDTDSDETGSGSTTDTLIDDTEPTGTDLSSPSTQYSPGSTESSASEDTNTTGTTDTPTSVDETTTAKPTDKTTRRLMLPDDTDEFFVTTEASETTESGPTDTSETTEASGTTESGPTDTSETTEASGTTESGSTDTSETTEASETTESGSTDTSETTEASGTTESGPTDTSETTEASGPTESGTTDTEASGTTESGPTDTSETTEASGTTESGPTDTSETTEASGTTESGPTDTSETTEASETTESGPTDTSETTEASETTESGPTDTSETTEASGTTVSGPTDTSETTEASGPTESGPTDTSETTEASGTTESGSTDTSETTQAIETTESGSTNTSETTEASDTTESGSTDTSETTEAIETTESGSTDTSETTEASDTTESGSTDTSETTEASGTTESGPTDTSETTEAIGTTESVSTLSSETASSALDWITTKKPRMCRPRTCLYTEFGCCPDKKTKAIGPFDEGCPELKKLCNETEYRCCPDGVTPARWPNHKGCPVPDCNETLFGCCLSDNKTAAVGNDQQGCPQPPAACKSSKFGCCRDEETEATGPAKEGCPETTVPETEPPSTTTLAYEGCEVSEFGCCFDNVTEAAGPDQQGCPCDDSKFGCCFDGVSPAQGPAFEGCLKNCNASAYGCCPDGESPAHGPNREGCCLRSAFGCCPDNYNFARGPHLEGCGCQYSPYGCCPDNVTSASGYGNKGCGCSNSPHGCCPDGHTEASGPKFEGCACHAYQFGCCSDGVTIASGPDGQGCHCIQSKYKCCGDGETHATGPNHEGCDCSSSKYGCCPDGHTEATGPKFQGCTDAPEDKQAACGLKYERGSCRNYSVSWYFDTAYGGCTRFWYGGCEGNGNRFATKDECDDTCISPPPKDACKLPQSKGACLSYNVRWYYDSQRESCTNFVYGGCLGNNNNFETRELCQKQCEPEKTTEHCSLPIEQGSCVGNFPRWGFNQETRKCEQFTWGGCEGNPNRFSSEAACTMRCDPPGKPKPECSKPQEVGNCSETEAVWSFSQSENRCVPFYYTGCGGNDNRFSSLEACEDSCPSAYVPDKCTLPYETGNCANYSEKWYFDTKDQRCRQFYYGGCGGNTNKFNSEQECQSDCQPIPTTSTVPPTAPQPAAPTQRTRPTILATKDFCFLAMDAGPCTNFTTSWGYDDKSGRCTTFQYGGCGGNRNNFPDEQYCQYYCKSTQDICQLPMMSGPCDDSQMRWFYDTSSDTCSQFTYGGCDGNDNRFESREECESRCKTGPAVVQITTVATTTVVVDARPNEDISTDCAISPSMEACSAEQAGEVWYLNVATRECTAHQNLADGERCRTTGVFKSQEGCERSCGAFRGIENVCQYPLDPGACSSFVPKYFFNETSDRCEQFAYGGCVGGPNRFSTELECQAICKPTLDPCKQQLEPGNCLGRYELWYYEERSNRCEQFIYGGCGGNENRFESRDACEGRCLQQPGEVAITTTTTQAPVQPVEPECTTPDSLAPCGANETVFYYDAGTSTCRVSGFGGCRHPNSYGSEEECERRCGVFRGLDVCRAQVDPGPCRAAFSKYFFDAATGACKEFVYGGCQGGPNRFSTEEECKDICEGARPPAPACLQEVATGESCGTLPSRRWHYSPARAACLVFAYQGCGGNDNNFVSYEECADVCNIPLDTNARDALCEPYKSECYALESRCEYGIRVTMAYDGCQHCSCEEPPNCERERQECERLRCPYGVDRTTGDNGCERCKCFEDPCSRANCLSNERCEASAYRDPATQAVQYSAHCVPDAPQAPQASTNTEPNISEEEGGTATLKCIFHGNPPPKITWRFGEITIDGNHDRYRLLSDGALEIVSLFRNDSGVYICVGDNYLGSAQQEIRLQVNDNTNEVPSECQPFEEHCAQLSCPYGVQKTKMSRGCVRCSCVQVEVNCTVLSLECDNLKCNYGVERIRGDDGCERCKCMQHPCANKQCPERERCVATPYRDAVTQENRYVTDCRSVEKVGSCPADGALGTESACRRECNDDADCRAVGKCCSQGCSRICLNPVEPTTRAPVTQHVTTYNPEAPQAPQSSTETEPEISVEEGGKATLKCIFHGNPPPKITWRFGEITIDGNHDRYRLLSDGALEIVSLFRNDSGVYICVGDNYLGSAQQEIRLQVNDPVIGPAFIAGEANVVIYGELDQPLEVRCQSYGHPTPAVYWYKGLNGPMVPIDNPQYEARGQILTIRKLSFEMLGEYACYAYNGQGKPATWVVTVKAYQPDDNAIDGRYLVPQDRVVFVTPREPTTDTTTTTTTTTQKPEIQTRPYIVEVHTELRPASTSISAGAELSLPCDVDGYPEPRVSWTKDGAQLAPTDRMWITDTRLTIPRATISDSGEYRCHASNQYSTHSSTVQINVQEIVIPAKCTDSPYFANCGLIVQAKFCRHNYYSKFCCKSCVEAGQLDPSEVAMQADEPYRKKK